MISSYCRNSFDSSPLNSANMSKKSRFDGLDVAAMTSFLQKTVIGFKLVNVYDGPAGNSNKGTYLFKLTNTFKSPSSSSSENKDETENEQSSNRSMMLLIESGVRFHMTNLSSSTGGGESSASALPSAFAMKLRKHIRNTRLEHVTQLGTLDRVVDFRFGNGPSAHHLILELYGQGNLVLTDANYVIMALLRVHEFETLATTTATENTNPTDEAGIQGGSVKVRVGNVYPVTYTTTLSWDSTAPKEGEEAADDKKTEASPSHTWSKSILDMNGEEAVQWALGQLQTMVDSKHMKQTSSSTVKSSKSQNASASIPFEPSITLKALLLRPSSGVFHYGPSVIEHCILHTQSISVQTKLTPTLIRQVMPPDSWNGLIHSLKEEGTRILDDFQAKESKGYIFYRLKSTPSGKLESSTTMSTESPSTTTIAILPHSDKLFEDFQPHLLHQHQGRPFLEYPTFTQAVDEFFSLLEGQRRSARFETAEATARQKLEKIRLDQEKRLQGLHADAQVMFQHAKLIELYADDVDKVLGVINSALASGMDWTSLEQLVAVEKAHENPIALLIHHLVLAQDQVVISLPESLVIPSPDDEYDFQDTPVVLVQISLSLHENSHGNARVLYEKYRLAKEKADKTMDASSKVMKAAEATAQKQLVEAQRNKKILSSIAAPRKVFWFEKYHWFVTSENYLVLAGRDAQQNEALVKKFLREGDAYVHADVHGAASCILRAKRQRISSPLLPPQATKTQASTVVLPISEQALREAGNFAICRSSAWSSKIITSAWWVHAHQVSKTAPTGEFLTTGSFVIRGKKNYLPATHLEMGVALLFCLGDDASIARHAHDRRDLHLRQQDEENLEKHTGASIPSVQSSSVELSIEQYEKQDKGSPHIESDNNEEENEQERDDLHHNNAKHVNLDEPAGLDSSTREVKGDMEGPHDTLSQRDTNQIDEEVDLSSNVSNGISIPFNASAESSTPAKKGLSVKDRKLIKKYGSLEAAEKAMSRLEQLEQNATKVKEEKSHLIQDVNNTAISRGKKSKMKKMAKKYYDQDEEDRELALLLLQGASKREKQDSVKEKGSRSNIIAPISSNQIKASAETAALLFKDSKSVAIKLPVRVQEILSKCIDANASVSDVKVWAKFFDADVLEEILKLSLDEQVAAVTRLHELNERARIENYSASLLGIIRTLKRFGLHVFTSSLDDLRPVAQNKEAIKDKMDTRKDTLAQPRMEVGITEDDGMNELDVIDDTAEINKLTGKPMPEDGLTHVIPVCGPYSTLSQFKYKVKLIPGTLKRGKAAKQCIDLFLKYSKTENRDSDLVKMMNENEIVQVLCGDVKIAVPGSKIAKK